MPPKFFITHSWKDIEFAQRLCDDLNRNGLDGFLDAHSISPGDSIRSRIERGLTECDVYIPIFSPDALQSDWCDWEIDMAITMNRTLKGRPRIIPVIARPCRVPIRLIHLLSVDFAVRGYDVALRELLTQGLGVSAPAPVRRESIQSPQIAVPPSPTIAVPPAPITSMPQVIIGKDDRERILIPAGEFLMGGEEHDDEKPPHKVNMDAFYIDRCPVTNADYQKFLEETRYKPIPEHWNNGQIPAGEENHPVVYVS